MRCKARTGTHTGWVQSPCPGPGSFILLHHVLAPSHTHFLIRSFPNSLSPLFICSLSHSLTYACICSLIHAISHSHIHLLSNQVYGPVFTYLQHPLLRGSRSTVEAATNAEILVVRIHGRRSPYLETFLFPFFLLKRCKSHITSK